MHHKFTLDDFLSIKLRNLKGQQISASSFYCLISLHQVKMDKLIFIISIWLNLSSSSVLKESLVLSCDCNNFVTCHSSGQFLGEISDNTKLLLSGCEALNAADMTELHLVWASKGISRSLHEFERLQFLRISRSVLRHPKGQIFQGLQELKKLSLIGNEIEELPEFVDLKSLEKVFLAQNKIQVIRKRNFVNLISLTFLTLEDNKIFYINSNAFAGNENLEELNSNRNDLSFLEPTTFQANLKLKELSLNHNVLRSLSEEIFRKNVRLEVLRLHGNELTNLHKNIFVNNPHLKWIELGGNQLHFIGSQVFRSLPTIEFVDFTFNGCIDDSFPTEMNLDHMLKLIERNCHYLAAYHLEIL